MSGWSDAETWEKLSTNLAPVIARIAKLRTSFRGKGSAGKPTLQQLEDLWKQVLRLVEGANTHIQITRDIIESLADLIPTLDKHEAEIKSLKAAIKTKRHRTSAAGKRRKRSEKSKRRHS